MSCATNRRMTFQIGMSNWLCLIVFVFSWLDSKLQWIMRKFNWKQNDDVFWILGNRMEHELMAYRREKYLKYVLFSRPNKWMTMNCIIIWIYNTAKSDRFKVKIDHKDDSKYSTRIHCMCVCVYVLILIIINAHVDIKKI